MPKSEKVGLEFRTGVFHETTIEFLIPANLETVLFVYECSST